MIEREIHESHLRLTFRKDMEILFLRWTKQVASAELRSGYLNALDFAQEHHVKLWLFDLRGRGSASPEDETWILEEFFGQMEERLGSHNYVAYLLSPGHFAYIKDNVGIEKLLAFSDSTKINVFMSESDGIDWLAEYHAVAIEARRK